MLARSGLVGKTAPGPISMIWGHFRPIDQQNIKARTGSCVAIFLGGPMGSIHSVWGNDCNMSIAIRMHVTFDSPGLIE